MRWFKHDSDAFTSEGVEALIAEFGFSGYGRWNRLLEIVAFKMDETDRCYVEYPIQKWCSLLGLKQKQLISFLKATEKQLKTKVKLNEKQLRIEIPNLLKKRDKYTRDLQKKGQLLTTTDIDIDKDIKKKKKKKKASFGSNGFLLPDEIDKIIWERFERHRKDIRKPLSDLSRQDNAAILIGKSLNDQKEIVAKTIRNHWQGLFPLKKSATQKSTLQIIKEANND